MNILHVLSHSIVRGGKEFTGADKYALTLAASQMGRGHQITIVADHLAEPSPAEFIACGIGQRRFYHRIANVVFLRQLLREKEIELIHAHSRAASWVTWVASRGTRIPLVSTVHGRQKLHWSTQAFDIYGNVIIAVCEKIREHLISELGIDSRKIVVVPNGIRFEDFPERLPKATTAAKPCITLIGRTTGEKGNKTVSFIETIVPEIIRQFPEAVFRHVGGDPANLKFGNPAERPADRVEFIGHVADLKPYFAQADVIVASGRVAIEALACGVPTIALGEACSHGLVSKINLNEVLATNFGDIVPHRDARPVDFSILGRDLAEFLRNPCPEIHLRKELAARFDMRKVEREIQEIYERANLVKKVGYIPVLMYHKIPLKPLKSKHKTFVPAPLFERHLQLMKNWGFSAITFRDYLEFQQGKRPLSRFPKKPVILTFDDGYLDNYQQAFPLLKRYGFKAVIFAMGDPSIRRNEWDIRTGEDPEPLMNHVQMREMSDWGIEFGAHTLTHPDLTQLSDDEALLEIAQSKRNLEASLGCPVISFAYPYGRFNESLKKMVREAGFSFGIATDSGGMNIGEDPFEIFRVQIFPRDRSWELFKKSSTIYRRYIRWKRGV